MLASTVEHALTFPMVSRAPVEQFLQARVASPALISIVEWSGQAIVLNV